jgi:MFS family permease
MQQFCGVNVIAYYSSEIFVEANFPEQQALAASLGFGIVNFLFAIPAFYTIDTFGRRNLLLTTFPVSTRNELWGSCELTAWAAHGSLPSLHGLQFLDP